MTGTIYAFNRTAACPSCHSIPCECTEADEEEARLCQEADIDLDRFWEEEEDGS